MDSKLVVVIGAGPSGLAVCKEILAAGLTPACFEQKDVLGGVFASSKWPFHLTSSSVLTAFSGFPPRDPTPTMWSKEQYLEYLQDYVDHFGLVPYIEYGVSIRRVEHHADTQQWRVEVVNKGGEIRQLNAAAVVVCSGTHASPKIPALVDPAKNYGFEGTVTHSSSLPWPPESLSPERRRRVLLVGLGETGSDLARLFTQLEPPSQVVISVREAAGWVAPRWRGKLPADLLTNRITWGLPRSFGGRVIRLLLGLSDRFLGQSRVFKAIGAYNLASKYASHGPYGVYGTKSSGFIEAVEDGMAVLRPAIDSLGPGKRVTFVDGTATESDLVVLSTGLVPSLTFLDDSMAAYAARPSSRLYGHVVPPDSAARGLYFVGFARPGFGAIPPLAEMQGRWIAGLISGNLHLPPADEMRRQIASYTADRSKLFRYHADTLPTLVDFIPYYEWLTERVGCQIQWDELAMLDPALFRRLLFGAFTSAQFRLFGPMALPVEARAHIFALPRPPRRPWAIVALIVYISCHVPFVFFSSLSPVGVGLPKDSTIRQRFRWLKTVLTGTVRGWFLDSSHDALVGEIGARD